MKPEELLKEVIALGCIWNDERILRKNLLSSEGLSGKQFDLYHCFSPLTASIGLNNIISLMEGKGYQIAVIVHQDVMLPFGWIDMLPAKLAKLPNDWFAAGVWGVRGVNEETVHYGRIAEGRITGFDGQYRVLGTKSLPARVDAIDECCIVFRLGKGFQFDESLLGFDLYGTEICYWAAANGYSSWVMDHHIIHNCTRPWEFCPDEIFVEKQRAIERKYNRPVLSTVLP